MTYDNRNRVDVITAKYPGQDDFILDYDYDDANRTSTVTDNGGVSVTSITDARAQLRTLLWQGTPAGDARVDMGYNQLGDKTSTHRYTGLAANPAALVFDTEYRFERGLTDIGAFASAYNNQGSGDAIDQLLSTEGFGPLDIQPDASNVLQDSTDPLSRMTRITNTRADESPLSSYEYVYDDADQLDEATDNGESLDYEYDLIGQLQDVARTAFNAEVYRYDDSGNRLRTDEQTTDNVIGDGNRIASDGAHTFGYDDEGNRISKTEIATGATWVYTYDHRNRMTEARQQTSVGAVIKTVTFAYDAQNRRIEKALEASPVRYTYMGDMIWSRTDAVRGNQFFLSFGIDQWLARANSSRIQWYDTDRMDSSRRVVDRTGNIIAERVYSSFGEILEDTSPTAFEGIGFTGREYDSSTGLNYFRGRYFDAESGTFVSEDPMNWRNDRGSTNFPDINTYRYTFNSPVNFRLPAILNG